jgi:hypothetical protein
MRLPLALGGVRAGGWISAGMISTVHVPLPMRAETRPKAWPQRCAPSPESETISTVCSGTLMTFCPLGFLAVFFFLVGVFVEDEGVISHSRADARAKVGRGSELRPVSENYRFSGRNCQRSGPVCDGARPGSINPCGTEE